MSTPYICMYDTSSSLCLYVSWYQQTLMRCGVEHKTVALTAGRGMRDDWGSKFRVEPICQCGMYCAGMHKETCRSGGRCEVRA